QARVTTGPGKRISVSETISLGCASTVTAPISFNKSTSAGLFADQFLTLASVFLYRLPGPALEKAFEICWATPRGDGMAKTLYHYPMIKGFLAAKTNFADSMQGFAGPGSDRGYTLFLCQGFPLCSGRGSAMFTKKWSASSGSLQIKNSPGEAKRSSHRHTPGRSEERRVGKEWES